MDLYCKTCNERLTNAPLKQAVSVGLLTKDQEPLLEEGTFVLAEEVKMDGLKHAKYLVSTDALFTLDHKDSTRHSGCCGPSGTFGPNQVCPKCASEIGSLHADCIGPHFVSILGDKVSEDPIW